MAFATGTIRDWKGTRYQKQADGTWLPIATVEEKPLCNPFTSEKTTIQELLRLRDGMVAEKEAHIAKARNLAHNGYNKDADREYKLSLKLQSKIDFVNKIVGQFQTK